MIDASTFAARHNAFWAEHTPTSEHFVRRLNLQHIERWNKPLNKPKGQIRSAFVAELAFSCFCAEIAGGREHEILEMSLKETKTRLRPIIDDPATLEEPLSETETAQMLKIKANLLSFFRSRNPKILTRPVFNGCGYIDTSEGDVLNNSYLFEIKAVERPFRSVDLRQLITYCALNHLSHQFEIEGIGVFNPRRGVYFVKHIDEISYEVAGQPAQDLFDNIVHAISSGDISR